LKAALSSYKNKISSSRCLFYNAHTLALSRASFRALARRSFLRFENPVRYSLSYFTHQNEIVSKNEPITICILAIHLKQHKPSGIRVKFNNEFFWAKKKAQLVLGR